MEARRLTAARISALAALALSVSACDAVFGIDDHSLEDGGPGPGATSGGSGAGSGGNAASGGTGAGWIEPSEASAGPAPASAWDAGTIPSASDSGVSAPSLCGNPGDLGNTMGVGAYCDNVTACASAANICSTIGNPSTHFCTLYCSPDAGGGGCGETATCTEEDGFAVCVPDACLGSLGEEDAGSAPSLCGNPGDHGNTAGVGAYCNSSNDCLVGAATTCSNIGNPNTHFCTEQCALDAGSGECGEQATCTFEEGLAFCVPDVCTGLGEDGG